MHMSLIQWLLPISIVVLESVILVVLAKRKLRADFPFFFSFVVFHIFGFLILAVTVRGSQEQYFYSYWSITALGMFLSFAVLYEVFVNALKPYSAVIDLAKMLFAWAGAFLLVTGGLTAFATAGSQISKVCAAVLVLERSVQLMQCGLLLLVVLFEAKFGLSWRSLSMSVALGLGLSAAVGLSASYLGARVPGWAPALYLLDNLVSLGVFGFWAVVLLLPQPERQSVQHSPKRLILERWNDALTSYGYSQTAAASSVVESFLPGIEKTVDRVMARKALQ